ncbi:UBP-type zinc finger domain-containing protein [Gordonia sp. TBRC 11910]|uniref:UBP-type zinc finger domain-containing protein n=1 Tax=Gordonia asplenii TaxID=2725283 RepID=A0A848KYY7_9ACTN|nr:UBP-type zinc finger domain-containing protein [Gordonia asplenii]NMO03599.1 UBP-type zinc finger domain-containing protein [Gordonia asplenii]
MVAFFKRSSADSAAPESSTPESDAPCEHLASIGLDPTDDPIVGSLECVGCIALGEHHWAHLRRCLSCGYVGCCDSSPRRHATAHFEESGHPVMRSAEPGESWRWCYVDTATG